ncbi:MAG: hypothetical protein JWO38_7167 [Gemmataceae bacterium]|nr:hypothetical protein [Gemmataceae bacterium]
MTPPVDWRTILLECPPDCPGRVLEYAVILDGGDFAVHAVRDARTLERLGEGDALARPECLREALNLDHWWRGRDTPYRDGTP